MRMATWGPLAMSVARAIARSSSSPSGTTSCSSPRSSASRAVTMRLWMKKSMVFATPMSWTQRYWPPSSGSSPNRSVALPRRALSAAMRKSQASARVMPVWMATPLTAAIAILSQLRSARLTVCDRWRKPSYVPMGLSCPCGMGSISGSPPMPLACPEMSSPAQNARPSPVMTSTRTRWSIWACRTVSTRSRLMAWLKPFSRSGVLKRIQAMPGSRTSTSKPWHAPVFIIVLHSRWSRRRTFRRPISSRPSYRLR